jgi:DNA-binding CsgD family transcriptional regulator
LTLDGLADEDARALLLGSLRAPLDAAVCDQIVAESHGNPLALLELPRTWNPAELAGGFGFPGGQQVASKIEQSYARRILELPTDTRLYVLVAAAEPLGDPVLLLRAAETFGLDTTAVHPAVEAGLLKIGARVEFAHPLVRSAVYRTASIDDRLRSHRALAEATDPEVDPDRRAWHRANGTSAPSEPMAEELERSASRAEARGGAAAGAAFLQRAVTLTADPARRGERALAAAQASLQAGAFDTALAFVTTAEAAPLDDFQRARVDLVRAHVAFTSGFGSDAPPLLLTAAHALEPFELDLARETYLAAWGAAEMAGSALGPGVLMDICQAVQALPRPERDPRPLELLLDGLALLMTDGHAGAAPTLQRAAHALGTISLDEVLRWGWMATFASTMVWDTESFHAISARHVQLVRDAGAVAQLPLHLWQLALLSMWTGDFSGAASLATESESVAQATGSRIPPYTWLRLRALQGREAEFLDVMADATKHAAVRGQGIITSGHWGAAVLYNGLGRYDEAAAEAGAAAQDTITRRPSMWALPELVEGAARCGDTERARDALDRLVATTQPCDTDFAHGIEARCRAVLSDGPAAEELYRQAIDRLSRTRLRPDLARAHLLYGEWLRREGRRVDAREQLRTAHASLSAMGMEAFAERARRELIGTGEKVRKHTDAARHQLTPQEDQIARLARDGMSNPAIGAQLFISARTVEWHLHKVFTKLDISSRGHLRAALPVDGLASV